MGAAAGASLIDADRQVAVANAYNRWIADFCMPYGDRLFGAGLIPMLSIDGALADIERIQKLGLKVGEVRPNPVMGRPLHDPYFYPVWDDVQESGLALGVHGLSVPANIGMDRFDSQSNFYQSEGAFERKCQSLSDEHCLTHTDEMIAAITIFVMSG